MDETRLKELANAVKTSDHEDGRLSTLNDETQMWRIFFKDYGVSEIKEKDENRNISNWWNTPSNEFPIQESVKREWWENLDDEGREEYRRRILHYTYPRKVKVYKNIEGGARDANGNKYRLHRAYEENDVVLHEILRKMDCTTRKILKNRFSELSPSYRASRALYKIVRLTTRSDDVWETFMRECCKLRREHSERYELEEDTYGLKDNGDDIERVDYVFRIPHTTGDGKNRDDTILSLVARKNPPLNVVKTILRFCPQAISYVDNPKWDCIPLNYAIKFGASPEVVEALIPTKEDVKQCKSLQEFDFLNSRGIHYRTPLHWAAYHDAPIETIRILKKRCEKHVLYKLDHCQLTPMETAMFHGRSTDKIKEFFVRNIKGYEVFEDVLAKLIRSLIYDESPFKYFKYDPFRDDNLCDSFIVNPDKSQEPQPTNDTYGDKGDQHPLEYGEKAIRAMDYHMPSISRSIAKSINLQKILSKRASCKLPTAVKLLDLYMSVALIVSYMRCTRRVLDTGKDISDAPIAILLIVAVSYMSWREFTEIIIRNATYLFSIWNYLDVLTIGLVWHSIVRMWHINLIDLKNDDEKIDNFGCLIIITTFCIWLNTISIFRSTFMPFAILISGTIRIFRSLIPLIIWTFLILVAFGQIFTIESLLESLVDNRCEDVESSDKLDFCTSDDSTTTTYSLFIGSDDFDLTEHKTTQIIFWIVAILVLQNIVIAIVTQAWEEIVEVSKEVFWDHRLNFLISVKDCKRFYTCCFRYYKSSSFKSSKNSRKKYDEDNKDVLSEWLSFLWPGGRYIGYHETMPDRIFSNGVGSLKWQILYQCRDATKKNRDLFKHFKQRSVDIIKAFLLVLLVCIVTVVCFIMGLMTLGLLWHKRIRRFIFGYELVEDEDKSKSKADKESNGSELDEEKSSSEVNEESSGSEVNEEKK